MPNPSQKSTNFRRLAEARTTGILEAFRKLANLSSPNYEYTQEEVKTIFTAIETALQEAKNAFNRDTTKKTRFKFEVAKPEIRAITYDPQEDE